MSGLRRARQGKLKGAEPVLLRILPSLLERVDQASREDGISRNVTLSRLIDMGLRARGKRGTDVQPR